MSPNNADFLLYPLQIVIYRSDFLPLIFALISFCSELSSRVASDQMPKFTNEKIYAQLVLRFDQNSATFNSAEHQVVDLLSTQLVTKRLVPLSAASK